MVDCRVVVSLNNATTILIMQQMTHIHIRIQRILTTTQCLLEAQQCADLLLDVVDPAQQRLSLLFLLLVVAAQSTSAALACTMRMCEEWSSGEWNKQYRKLTTCFLPILSYINK